MKKKFLLIVLILIPITFSGCIQIGESNDFGGVFRSVDKGITFQQKVLMATPKPTLVSIGNVDILSMEKDPQDNNAIYIGTAANGLYYTYDSAESWHQAAALGQSQINSITVSPDNKCTIYVSIQNKIFMSKDCNRTYKEIYHDPRVSVIITEISINPLNTSIIFAGTSAGDLLESNDGGESWAYMYNFKAMVKDIIFDRNSSNVFAATTNKIYKLNGKEWDDISDAKEIQQSFRNIRKMVRIEKSGGGIIMLLTSKDILASYDDGKTWQALKLITPPGKVSLYSMDININNTNEIIYGTSSAFVSSTDGGKTWTSVKLPSIRIPVFLIINQGNANIIYMGMHKTS
ncbi:MAG: hypothetical protein V1860_00610 [bacterium]